MLVPKEFFKTSDIAECLRSITLNIAPWPRVLCGEVIELCLVPSSSVAIVLCGQVIGLRLIPSTSVAKSSMWTSHWVTAVASCSFQLREQEYHVDKSLGVGSFGMVMSVRRADGEVFAAKVGRRPTHFVVLSCRASLCTFQ